VYVHTFLLSLGVSRQAHVSPTCVTEFLVYLA
jgi:hypothetical protein